MNKIYTTHAPEETEAAGQSIAADLTAGDVIALHGELGAGKTTLVKGIAAGLGIADTIVSPTFALMNVYPILSKKRNAEQLAHIDTYRLETEEQLIAIGAEDYVGAPDTITIIEWPEKCDTLLQNKRIIRISITAPDEATREIEIDS